MTTQVSSPHNPAHALGVCYYPEQWAPEKWTTDLDAMRELGIRFVRIGEFAWSRLEPNPGEYRFEWMQEILDLAAQRQLSAHARAHWHAPRMDGSFSHRTAPHQGRTTRWNHRDA